MTILVVEASFQGFECYFHVCIAWDDLCEVTLGLSVDPWIMQKKSAGFVGVQPVDQSLQSLKIGSSKDGIAAEKNDRFDVEPLGCRGVPAGF